jgi:hypothetical protein
MAEAACLACVRFTMSVSVPSWSRMRYIVGRPEFRQALTLQIKSPHKGGPLTVFLKVSWESGAICAGRIDP